MRLIPGHATRGKGIRYDLFAESEASKPEMLAKPEGVSLSMLVLTFVAEGLGRREHAH